MPKKTKPRRSAKKSPAKTPVLKRLVRRFLGLFVEELPVTELQTSGKPSIELAEVKQPDHQAALEILCGGRSSKAHKHVAPALLTPELKTNVWRVTIEGKFVGQLKPADAKFLSKQLSKADLELCAVKVTALIEGGRRKKTGESEDFTVKVTFPPRPQKKIAPPPENTPPDSAEDDAEASRS